MSFTEDTVIIHRCQVNEKDAGMTICESPTLVDEIEILFNSDYHDCHDCIHNNTMTFISVQKPGTASPKPKNKQSRITKTNSGVKSRPSKGKSLRHTASSSASKKRKTGSRTSPKEPGKYGRMQTVASLEKEKAKLDIKVRDIIWARYAANQPYWPSYVKSVSTNFVRIFYISRTFFSHSQPPDKKPKNEVILFSTSDVKRLMLQGLNYYRNRVLWSDFEEFENAVSLARTYIKMKHKWHFNLATEDSIFDFFNQDIPTRPIPVQGLMSPPTTTENTPRKRLAFSKSDRKGKKLQNGLDDDSHQKQNSESNGSFENLFQQVLDYICQGNCDNHVTDVLNGTFKSWRMDVFDQGPMPRQQRLEWEEKHVRLFFLNQDEQDLVMQRARKCLTQHLAKSGDKISTREMVRLLFSVVNPTMIIWAISKVQRNSYAKAEEIYISSQCLGVEHQV